MRLLAVILLLRAPFDANVNGLGVEEWTKSSKSRQQTGECQKRKKVTKTETGVVTGGPDSGGRNEGENRQTKTRAGGDQRPNRSGESRKAAEVRFGDYAKSCIKEIRTHLCRAKAGHCFSVRRCTAAVSVVSGLTVCSESKINMAMAVMCKEILLPSLPVLKDCALNTPGGGVFIASL